MIGDGFGFVMLGKGCLVWIVFGYFLVDFNLKVFVLYDCDIVDYDWFFLIRFCLLMVYFSLDFDFCKVYYV